MGRASPTVAPSVCPTISGPAPPCAPVNEAGRADVTDQASNVALRMETRVGLVFSPTFIRPRPGAKVTVTLVNTLKSTDFSSTHTFTIDSLKVNEALGPGETKTITFVLPAGEAYLFFYCAVGGSRRHRPAGMQGAFYIG